MSKPYEILLIDDDQMTLFIHEKIIQRCELDYPHRSFNTGKSCLSFLSENDQEDKKYILLLDINMPIMNGWDVLDTLKTMQLKCKYVVIMATSSVDFEDKKRSESYSDVVDFFEKPLTIATCQRLLQLPEVTAL